MLKEHPSASNAKAITILKISADQISVPDPSDITPIPITQAWVETSTVTTLGELEKIDAAPQSAFLGASKGAGLFFEILKGIRKSDLVIGYRQKAERLPKIFQAPGPPVKIFTQLQGCLAKSAAFF